MSGSFSKSSGSSQSSSLDQSFNTSFSDSLSQALSSSRGQSTSTQNVWNADVLKKLYGDALGAAGQVDTGLFEGQAAQLFNAGSSILDTLGVGAGEDYLASRLTDNSSRDAQLDVLEQRMGTLFNEELNPAITARHVAGGTLGGGRQGVAQGQAAGRVAREFSAGATDIISRDQLAKDAAAGQLITGRNQAAQIGAQLLPGMLSTAQAGLGAPLSPYTSLAGILGGPLALTDSQSTNEASSESVARAISEALGFSYGTSQSSSKNKSMSVSGGIQF